MCWSDTVPICEVVSISIRQQHQQLLDSGMSIILRCMLHVSSMTQAALWTKYAELEMASGNAAQVKHIFSRCLLTCPNVDLWFTYLKFIKKVRKPAGMDGRDFTDAACM